ncbi:DMT family transporter [Anaerosinus massiliensis]|uniref:DMT family transporter n=1 Tax=Massilibacillus massiliensis TaxID=1806837 RepID=UPI000A6278A2|nr:DMT family transporter [Massilibacillus massiliensis]
MTEVEQINCRKKGIVLVLLGAILWGASGVAAQYLFHYKHLSPEWLVVVRLLTSGLLLLLYDFIKNRANLFYIWKIKHDRCQLLLFSIFGMLGVQYTYFAAIQHGNAATATILQYLMPVIVACYLALRYKKPPNKLEQISIFLAMLGTFLLVTKGDFRNLAISPLALFWGIASAFCAAFYTLQPKYLLSHWRSPLVIGWGMLTGGIIMSPINPPWKFSGIWDIDTFFVICFIILFGTVIAFYSYLESIKYILPTETSTLASMEPLSAVLLSIYCLHTPFGWIDYIGGLSIMATVFLLAKKQ